MLQCVEGAHRGGYKRSDSVRTSASQQEECVIDYDAMYKDFCYPQRDDIEATMNYIAPKECPVILHETYNFNVYNYYTY